MSKSLVALLIAGALILLSALEITYMSTQSTEPSKQVALPLNEGRTRRIHPRAAVSVLQGLPTQVAPGSVPLRAALSEPPLGQNNVRHSRGDD